jgi:hypothetical protein
MKSVRKYILICMIFVAIVIAVAAGSLFFGPDRIEIVGRSLGEVIESDWRGLLAISLVILIFGLSLLPFRHFLFPPAIKNGIDGKAEVLKVWDTGVSINDDPQVGLLLELTSPGGAPIQVEARHVVSRLSVAHVQPGVMALIYYDPANLKHIEVKSFEVPAENASRSAEARLKELDGLREKGLITQMEYERKREEILKAP